MTNQLALVDLLTMQDLVRLTGHPVHRVRHAIRTRQIPPLRVLSGVRVFGPEVLKPLQEALAENGSGKRGGRPRVLGLRSV